MSVHRVRVQRISTGDAPGAPVEETIGLVPEAPVTIEIDGGPTFTILCTPRDRRALAVGFLFYEGLIESADQVAQLDLPEDRGAVIRVRLAEEAPQTAGPGPASISQVGSEALARRIASLPQVGHHLEVRGQVLRAASAALRKSQSLFEASGGTHAAGIFDEAGTLLTWAEDVGRHNALDKAIGQCLIAGIPVAGRGAALSGRVSLEMAAKCARAGIELIAAVSAPTSLAVDAAQRCNMTLCAFVRDERATVFTHPARIVS
jgi:FdhD protein